MKFIDTHCHLYDEAYGGIEGQDEAIKKAIGASGRRLKISSYRWICDTYIVS